MKPSTNMHTLASLQALIADTLKRYLASPGAINRRFHVPSLEGRMRHIPGKPLHVMPELFLQLNGMNRIEFPTERYDLTPGHICLIPRGLPHGERFIRTRGRFCMIVVMFDPQRIRFSLNDLYSRPQRSCGLTRIADTTDSVRIAAALDDLARMAQSGDEWHRQARREFGLGILAWLGATLTTQPMSERYSQKVARTLLLISEHLENPELGTATLARWIGCAPDYLSDRFHKETGMPLIQHMQRERLNKARYLLDHSPMRIKELAGACGFEDPDYFGRLFHRFAGLTPSQYRSHHPEAAR